MLPNYILLEAGETDAPDFIALVNHLMSVWAREHRVVEIKQIKIKNWFDHKWLEYAGYRLIHFEKIDDNERHIAKQSTWRKKTVVPPFNPNRVLGEWYFSRYETWNQQLERNVHRWQPSNKNIHNRINTLTESGLFVWYASNSEINQQGSLMFYLVKDGVVKSWYASAINQQGWQLNRAKGIGLEELQQQLALEPEVRNA